VYAAATVVAYPSAYEGFGLPVLEALACGTPVVASDAGSLSELFAGRAWLVDDRRESWRNALARLLDDADERRRWVERALPWAQRHDWGAAARLLRALLVEAAGDPANGSRR
jgi:glycosyltransferase involved in cell wall biosynthesis